MSITVKTISLAPQILSACMKLIKVLFLIDLGPSAPVEPDEIQDNFSFPQSNMDGLDAPQ